MRSCQHHERCYKPGGTKAIKAAARNTYICNARTCCMAGGGRGAGSAGRLYEGTSLSVTQPRAGISFKLNNKLKEEDGKEHNEGSKTRKSKNKQQISWFPANAWLSANSLLRMNTIHHFHIARSRRHHAENYKYDYNYASFPLPEGLNTDALHNHPNLTLA